MREKDAIERINALPNGVGGATWVGRSNMGTQTFTTDELKSLTAELAALAAENARLREALEHYADEKIWAPCDTNRFAERHYSGEVLRNGYDIAREALAR